MLKKTQLSEKLKKLKVEGTSIEKPDTVRNEPEQKPQLKVEETEIQIEPGQKTIEKKIPDKPQIKEVSIEEPIIKKVPKPREIKPEKPGPVEPVQPKSEIKKEAVKPKKDVPKPQRPDSLPNKDVLEMQKPKPALKSKVREAAAYINAISTTEPLKTQPDVKKEQILQVKKADEIEEKKPEEIIEPLISEKKKLSFISDLAIPTQKLSKLFKIETTYTEDTLNQILTAWKDPEKIIKWTAKLDKHGQEFYSLKGEGLMKMKDNPPIYGMEFDDGGIISTHMGDYTFIMGCYNFDVKTLVKIFAFGVENAKRFNL